MTKTKKKNYEKNLIVLNSSIEKVNFKIDAVTDIAKFKKQILKAGEYNFPNSTTRTIDFNEEYFKLIIEAFKDGAVDNVPIIIGTHDESQTEKIIGRVIELVLEESGLYAIMEVADEDIVDKIETQLSDGKGVIDEVSVSLGPSITDEGKQYPLALFHVAIVTHAWYQGMDSFERLAAVLRRENGKESIIINAVSSIEDKATQVRMAFYSRRINSCVWLRCSRSCYCDYNVEGVYDSFVIVYSYEDGFYYRFDYSMSDEGIIFNEAVKVEKEFVEANMEIDEILKGLKDNGVEVKDLDELKSMLAASTEQKTTLDKLTAALMPDAKDDNADYTKMLAAVNGLTTLVKELSERNKNMEATNIQAKAEFTVDKLVEAGKVIPAQKDNYISLFTQNKELFDSLTANMPEIVPLGQAGADGGKDDNAGGDIDPDKESDRILAAHVNKNGKES